MTATGEYARNEGGRRERERREKEHYGFYRVLQRYGVFGADAFQKRPFIDSNIPPNNMGNKLTNNHIHIIPKTLLRK